MHSTTQGLLVKKIFVEVFHVHTHSYACIHAHAHVCTQQLKEEKRSAIVGVEKMLDTTRTQPIQSENYSLTYEGWILKVLVHLRMEILTSPDLYIETYMTSFSDRLFLFFFFSSQACQVNDSSADSAVSKCSSFSLCHVSGKYPMCLNHVIKP